MQRRALEALAVDQGLILNLVRLLDLMLSEVNTQTCLLGISGVGISEGGDGGCGSQFARLGRRLPWYDMHLLRPGLCLRPCSGASPTRSHLRPHQAHIDLLARALDTLDATFVAPVATSMRRAGSSSSHRQTASGSSGVGGWTGRIAAGSPAACNAGPTAAQAPSSTGK